MAGFAKNFGNSAWILQEDSAPCHVSRQCNAWKADNNIPILPWPAQSPDINVIENVWSVLKIHIKGNARVKQLMLYITELVLRKLYAILSNPIYIRYRLYSCFSYQILAHWGNSLS